eukprot:15365210-Ditylum_brightwellii.AAC.3
MALVAIGKKLRLLPRGGYVNDDDHSIGGGARNGTETIQNQLLARADGGGGFGCVDLMPRNKVKVFEPPMRKEGGGCG